MQKGTTRCIGQGVPLCHLKRIGIVSVSSITAQMLSGRQRNITQNQMVVFSVHEKATSLNKSWPKKLFLKI